MGEAVFGSPETLFKELNGVTYAITEQGKNARYDEATKQVSEKYGNVFKNAEVFKPFTSSSGSQNAMGTLLSDPLDSTLNVINGEVGKQVVVRQR